MPATGIPYSNSFQVSLVIKENMRISVYTEKIYQLLTYMNALYFLMNLNIPLLNN